ncbi:AAA domain-containing protein [Butyrivibrio sp. NC2007]|uniref:AAA domain-containing protein n=1 Tax=Butyrivibrio sp. NC2007 TaxID=1280683 RepID=UPI0003B5A8C7|nr:AAA domain-containing protein [Butyrivibrio sp. NC2007]
MKSFSECPFKVSLPKLVKNGKSVDLSFDILSKLGVSSMVVPDSIQLADTLGHEYEYSVEDICKKADQSSKRVELGMELYDSGMLLVRNSRFKIAFLTFDGVKYIVEYSVKEDGKTVLEDVISQEMELSDRTKFGIEIAKAYGDSEEDIQKEDAEEEPTSQDSYSDYTDYSTQNPTIKEFRNAILREKYFLQEEGGRKYKVTNGKIISRKGGISTYSFEMEAELFLTDDAPIKLESGGKEANGIVVSCESFQIIINVDRDFGLTINQAFISVEPWKLLEAIANDLDHISDCHPLALKLINEGPGLATTDPISSIPKGQDAAINRAISEDITLIWGPPGTGKTYTMAKIALDALKKNKSVLVVSHSNVSVDGVVKETVKQANLDGLDKLLKDGEILRYGYVRDEKLSKDPYAVAYNFALRHRPELKKELEELTDKKKQLKREGNYNTSEGAAVENKLKEVRKRIRDAEKRYVEKAQFVATTISKVTIDKLFADAGYDVVMFDEVSMAYIPQILCAAMRADEKLILVGDFRQLSPIVQSEAKKTLEKDIFTLLGISSMGKMYAHPWLVMLNEQRRMYPTISEFSNKNVYNNLLLDHPSVKKNREDIITREPFYDYSINLIDLLGTYCATMKNGDNSRFNIVSAIVSFLSALNGEADGQQSIGIITPYAAQTRLIRAMILDHRENEDTAIECSTVHQFQGSERDVIIFDAVESYPSTKVGFLMGKSMDAVTRLINVAVTRARGKLVVVANSKYWEKRFGNTSHIFYRLIQYLQKNGNVTSTHEKKIHNYIMQLPDTKKIKNYQDEMEAIDAFINDVKRAKDRIVVSIPDGRLYEEFSDPVLKALLEARANGIRILCKTNGYEDLPDNWKNIAWASDNAVFPVIMIDESVMWYGLPKSRGRFKDGDTGFATVCQTIYRIKGEHTLELIRTFADLEIRELKGEKSALQEKTGTTSNESKLKGSSSKNEDTGKEAAGLAAYVQKREKCPSCKMPMMLTRSKAGKCYLKCKSCKETAFLTPELTNEYIDHYQVKCPIHHAEIYAGVNKYGIYVKCEYGHYMKPDEI